MTDERGYEAQGGEARRVTGWRRRRRRKGYGREDLGHFEVVFFDVQCCRLVVVVVVWW